MKKNSKNDCVVAVLTALFVLNLLSASSLYQV